MNIDQRQLVGFKLQVWSYWIPEQIKALNGFLLILLPWQQIQNTYEVAVLTFPWKMSSLIPAPQVHIKDQNWRQYNLSASYWRMF